LSVDLTKDGVVPERTAAVVLAAGDGKRLKSKLPKVLHPAAGRSLLSHVLAALAPLSLDETVVVASGRVDEIRNGVAGDGLEQGISYAVQDPPRGTGEAAKIALAELSTTDATILVVPGDTPLIETDTLFRLLSVHRSTEAAATLLTAIVHDPTGYGRILRTAGQEVERIVEEQDATPDQRRLHEINAGVFVFDGRQVAGLLDKIDCDNTQGEYYLTDVIELLKGEERKVVAVETEPEEVTGVNNRSQLAYVSGLLRHRVCERWMSEGVSIVDPRTTYIDTTVAIAGDATIHPFTFLEGTTTIAEGAEVGPQARIIDSEIGSEATVSFAVVRGSVVGPRASVGPFASLRPGNVLKSGAKVGTFVEAKQSTFGEDSRANHLSYLGDAEIGERANIGAGTITCNWDGTAKHRTEIGEEAYISSDTMLVAPVRVGRRAATGAGSVVREDVPDEALAVGVPARIIEGKGNRIKRQDE
jgi:bifunctional UDP-N-acetylglucosamine pyrophosphorylase / glucosamine-1-phosphate N-acetyltransferase